MIRMRFTTGQAILLALAVAALAAYPFVEGFQMAPESSGGVVSEISSTKTSSTNPGIGDLFSQPWAITLLVIAAAITAYGFLKPQ